MNNQSIIQGLISLKIKPDHVYMHLVESAPFNEGKTKIYAGVPENLVAFACKLSFQRGHDGNVSFISKTQLVQHYVDTLGAVYFGGRAKPLPALNRIYSVLFTAFINCRFIV